MTAYLFDIGILVILVLFVIFGARKGFVLTLFGLAGLFVAFFGARFLSARLYQPVSSLIQPGIYETITGVDSSGTPGPSAEPSLSPSPDAEPESSAGDRSDAALSLDDLLERIKSAELYKGLTGLLEDAVQDDKIPENTGTPASALAGYLADLIAKVVLFIAGFLVILLLWTLLGRLLDLACRLPVLSAANHLGGAALGLVKGALIVIILVWLGQLMGFIPREPTTPVLKLFSNGNLIRLLDGLVK